MKCPKCGIPDNKADAIYCHNCSAELRKNYLNPALDKELLEIIEVNSYSKKILSAYKARKYATEICKKKYRKKNYKEYVEMLMVKYFPDEHKKSELGKRYVRWRNFLILCLPVLGWIILPILPIRRKLKKMYK
jgi:hypothetical protein